MLRLRCAPRSTPSARSAWRGEAITDPTPSPESLAAERDWIDGLAERRYFYGNNDLARRFDAFAASRAKLFVDDRVQLAQRVEQAEDQLNRHEKASIARNHDLIVRAEKVEAERDAARAEVERLRAAIEATLGFEISGTYDAKATYTARKQIEWQAYRAGLCAALANEKGDR